MEKRSKEIMFFLGSVFVALIFLSSMIGSGNVISGPSGGQGQQKNVTTFFAAGTVNATVTGYESSAVVTLANESLDNETNTLLLGLEDNGSVTTYNQMGNQFSIYLGTMDSYGLQGMLSDRLGNSSFTISSRMLVSLPGIVTLHAYNQSIPVRFKQGSYSLSATHMEAVNSSMPMYVSAIVAFVNNSYEVYNGNVSVRSAG